MWLFLEIIAHFSVSCVLTSDSSHRDESDVYTHDNAFVQKLTKRYHMKT